MSKIRIQMPISTADNREAWEAERDAVVALANRFGTVYAEVAENGDLILDIGPYEEQPTFSPADAAGLALTATGREVVTEEEEEIEEENGKNP